MFAVTSFLANNGITHYYIDYEENVVLVPESLRRRVMELLDFTPNDFAVEVAKYGWRFRFVPEPKA